MMKRSYSMFILMVVALLLSATMSVSLCEAVNYEKTLARAEANQPLVTIVETVREESNMYPRPTKIDLFKEPVFSINPRRLETYIQQILEHEEYQDIKRLQASTGVHYLYSTRHLSDDFARALVEWEEVEQHRNQ